MIFYEDPENNWAMGIICAIGFAFYTIWLESYGETFIDMFINKYMIRNFCLIVYMLSISGIIYCMLRHSKLYEIISFFIYNYFILLIFFNLLSKIIKIKSLLIK